MKIQTTRSCKVQEYYLRMEVGWERNRGDIIAYAKLARENDGRLSSEDIKDKLLGKCSPQTPLSILNYCVNNRIFRWEEVDTSVILTDSGWGCAENEIYYEFEEDIFHISLPDDPYCPCEVLSCNRVGHTDERLKGDPIYIKIPDTICSIKGSEFEIPHVIKINKEKQTAYEKGKIFSVDDYCVQLDGRNRISIEGEISEDSVLTEHISNKEMNFWKRPDISFDLIKNKIQIAYPDTFCNINNHESFITPFPTPDHVKPSYDLTGNVSLCKMNLNELSGSEPVDIELIDCQLIPKSTEDARNWYFSLIEDEVTDYLSEDNLQEIFSKKMEIFKEINEDYLENLRSDRMTFLNYLLRKYGAFTLKYWFIQTPVDLSLEG